MQHKILLSGLFVSFAMACAVAQTPPLASSSLMRAQQQALWRDLNMMQKGEAPYDQAKVDSALVVLRDTSANITKVFPDGAKGKASAGSKYIASTKVWDTSDDFKAKAAKMSQAVESVFGKIRSLDDLKASYNSLNDGCEICHETYRLRNG